MEKVSIFKLMPLKWLNIMEFFNQYDSIGQM